MLQRALAKESVAERQQQLFHAAGIRHYKQLAMRSSWDLAQAVDVSVQEMEDLFARISTRLAPPSRTAFEMFIESANHPVFLRTGLPALDQALNGGINYGGITEFAGIAGIGKSQLAMTLSVLCAIEYPAATILYFDTEHNFSAKRIFEIATARVRLRNVHPDANVELMAQEIVKRIRLVKIDSLGKFIHKLKELEESMHAMNVKLLVIDSVASLFMKSNDQTPAQRQHQMLKLTRDLKLLADTHHAFVVVTNRASTAGGAAGLYTRAHLGETWAHCATTRVVLERYPQHRIMAVVKSPVAGYVIQPYAIDESGVEALVDEATLSTVETDNFDVHDDLLYNLASLPMVEPSCTLRSTQKSSAREENDGENSDESSFDLFDLVSDSNDEDDAYDKSIGDLTEDR